MVNTTRGKTRSPLAVILFSTITIGIYGLSWQYATFKEIRSSSGRGMPGWLGLMFAILLGIVNSFVLSAEVGHLYAADGQEKPVCGLTGFWVLPPIVGGIIWVVTTQGWLNRYWTSRALSA